MKRLAVLLYFLVSCCALGQPGYVPANLTAISTNEVDYLWTGTNYSLYTAPTSRTEHTCQHAWDWLDDRLSGFDPDGYFMSGTNIVGVLYTNNEWYALKGTNIYDTFYTNLTWYAMKGTNILGAYYNPTTLTWNALKGTNIWDTDYSNETWYAMKGTNIFNAVYNNNTKTWMALRGTNIVGASYDTNTMNWNVWTIHGFTNNGTEWFPPDVEYLSKYTTIEGYTNSTWTSFLKHDYPSLVAYRTGSNLYSLSSNYFVNNFVSFDASPVYDPGSLSSMTLDANGFYLIAGTYVVSAYADIHQEDYDSYTNTVTYDLNFSKAGGNFTDRLRATTTTPMSPDNVISLGGVLIVPTTAYYQLNYQVNVEDAITEAWIQEIVVCIAQLDRY